MAPWVGLGESRGLGCSSGVIRLGHRPGYSSVDLREDDVDAAGVADATGGRTTWHALILRPMRPHIRRPALARRPGLRSLLLCGLLTVGPVGCQARSASPPPSAAPATAQGPPPASRVQLGAYYSLWYPANSAQGTLREHLVPGQPVDLAKVDSADPRVAERAIEQASSSGIDFFAVQWSPANPYWNANFDAFTKARNLSDIRFCAFYMTQDLGIELGIATTPVTATTTAHFVASMTLLASKYFSNPSYLRVGGRPVVVLYLTRTLVGDVPGMIGAARTSLIDAGYGDPFFVGDEISWDTTVETPSGTQPQFTQTPQVNRLKLFDALTAYTIYDGGPPKPAIPPDFVGYPGSTNLVADEVGLYRRFAAADTAIPVLPDAMPGINTRGVRLSYDQPAEPRQWLPGQSASSTLHSYLWDVVAPVLDSRLPIAFVTSWNEWNEDTAVQPVLGTPTSRDDSPTASEYTQGYLYGAEGDSDLREIRDFSSAVYGFAGAPAGSVVQVVAAGKVLGAGHVDHEGMYVIPRTALTAGVAELVCDGRSFPLQLRPDVAVHRDCAAAGPTTARAGGA